MLLNGGTLDGKRVLSPSSVRLMTANHVGSLRLELGDGIGFGLGVDVTLDLGARGTPGSAGEYGWGGAYHSSYWVDPAEGLVVVYFTQLIPGRRRRRPREAPGPRVPGARVGRVGSSIPRGGASSSGNG